MAQNTIKCDFTSTSISDVQKAITGFGSEVQNKIVGKAIYDSMEPALTEAQQRVPKARGYLLDSLAVQRINEFDAPGAKIVARKGKQFHGAGSLAHLIEFGHRIVIRTRTGLQTVGHQPAHAFLRPALADNKELIVARVGYAVSEAAKKYSSTGRTGGGSGGGIDNTGGS